VQRLTFDSYLYKRVVAMNPWQQLKLTFRTFASVLRGQALAPSGYRPVASAVRTEEEVAQLLAPPAGTGNETRAINGIDQDPGAASATDRQPVLSR